MKEEKKDLKRQREAVGGKGWEYVRPVDQTESNNSRGITTLAHGNRSYPEEMAGTRREIERVKWRHSRWRKEG